MFASVTCFVLYMAVAAWVGFYGATLLFMLLMPLLLSIDCGRRAEMPRIAIVAVLFTLILYLVFSQFLLVPTPKGLLL